MNARAQALEVDKEKRTADSQPQQSPSGLGLSSSDAPSAHSSPVIFSSLSSDGQAAPIAATTQAIEQEAAVQASTQEATAQSQAAVKAVPG